MFLSGWKFESDGQVRKPAKNRASVPGVDPNLAGEGIYRTDLRPFRRRRSAAFRAIRNSKISPACSKATPTCGDAIMCRPAIRIDMSHVAFTNGNKQVHWTRSVSAVASTAEESAGEDLYRSRGRRREAHPAIRYAKSFLHDCFPTDPEIGWKESLFWGSD